MLINNGTYFFLHAKYTLSDCIPGDFVQGKAGPTAPPFIQLLSTTVPAEAHADFVSTRLNGVDTTGSQTLLPNITASGPYNTFAAANNNSGGFTGFVQNFKWAIIGISIGLAILLAILLWYYCRRRSGRKEGLVAGEDRPYRALNEPAPFGNDHYVFVQKPF
jgi:hypothetical protein